MILSYFFIPPNIMLVYLLLLNVSCFVSKVVVLDLINKTRDLRLELIQKEQTITHLSEDVTDITVIYSST